MAKKFNMEKIAGKNTIELGKQNMNDASLALARNNRKTVYVNIDLIDPHPLNNLSMAKVPWLKENIKQYGLLQPLLAAQKPDGRYQLYAGHQRLMAVSELREEEVWGETVEIKLFDMDKLKLPQDFRPEIKEKLILRSANIQRGNNYESDADKYVVIQDWKEIYAEFRRCGVEVFEYGMEDDDNAMKQQIKGVKTQNLVSEKLGISHAQVAKFDKVTNQGADLVVEVLKEDKIGVATAAEIVNRPKEVQEKLIKKILEKKPIREKITQDDILLAEKELKQKEEKEDSQREDGQIADGQKADGQKASGQIADGQKANRQKADGQKADGQKASGQIADGQKANRQIADGQKASGQKDNEQKEEENVPSSGESEENASPELYIINDKAFRSDIKEIMNELKKSQGIALDTAGYMSYLKHLNAIYKTLIKARK